MLATFLEKTSANVKKYANIGYYTSRYHYHLRCFKPVAISVVVEINSATQHIQITQNFHSSFSIQKNLGPIAPLFTVLVSIELKAVRIEYRVS